MYPLFESLFKGSEMYTRMDAQTDLGILITLLRESSDFAGDVRQLLDNPEHELTVIIFTKSVTSVLRTGRLTGSSESSSHDGLFLGLAKLLYDAVEINDSHAISAIVNGFEMFIVVNPLFTASVLAIADSVHNVV
jgi:hypothetical protein